MSRVSPILFNTEMVRAILEGRKTVTRRLIKAPVLSKVEPPKKVTLKNGVANFEWNTPKTAGGFEIKMPYQPGDILYVRETWYKGLNRILYKANYSENEKFYTNGKEIQIRWRPSIHMPKEAARIFLRVTNVRVERLQDVRYMDCIHEGIPYKQIEKYMISGFSKVWDATIKRSDLDRYGWGANPYVFVIEFERCEKPEGWCV